jgi:protein-S-isoprenylcysteine O-methyltransferase Ste14
MAARLFVFLRSAVVSAFFVSLWTWFVPRWFAGGDLHPQWSVPAIVLMFIGAAVMLRCVFDFAWTGRGTPAPFDPPRRLVVRGLYRYVRNPMYVGMAVFLVGEAIALPEVRRPMLLLLAALAVIVNLFILFYEEPTLRRLFGADYEAYCRAVRRWIPRLRPFDNGGAAAVRSPDLD